MTIKKYALINDNNQVVNCVLIDDSSEQSLFDLITKTNNATRYLDMEVYGLTEPNGHFDGTRLWPTKPYPSWIKGEENWVAPKPYPNDGQVYLWNEDAVDWDLLNP